MSLFSFKTHLKTGLPCFILASGFLSWLSHLCVSVCVWVRERVYAKERERQMTGRRSWVCLLYHDLSGFSPFLSVRVTGTTNCFSHGCGLFVCGRSSCTNHKAHTLTHSHIPSHIPELACRADQLVPMSERQLVHLPRTINRSLWGLQGVFGNLSSGMSSGFISVACRRIL